MARRRKIVHDSEFIFQRKNRGKPVGMVRIF